jgi:hypothetical protein
MTPLVCHCERSAAISLWTKLPSNYNYTSLPQGKHFCQIVSAPHNGLDFFSFFDTMQEHQDKNGTKSIVSKKPP